MLSKVNGSSNSRQTIDNIHNDFQPFACITTERFDNTLKDKSNYYLMEESKKDCQEETTQNKADKLLTSFKRDNQSRRQAKRYSKVETLHLLNCSVIKIEQDSQVNMNLSMLKILKLITFNLSTKSIKLLCKGFFFSDHFLRTTVTECSLA